MTHKHADIADYLLQLPNINVNVLGERNETALHLAVRNGLVDSCRALPVFPDINVNAQDSDGYTALHLAVLRGDFELVIMLLQVRGIQVSIRSEKRVTPASIARQFKLNEIKKMIKKHPSYKMWKEQFTGLAEPLAE